MQSLHICMVHCGIRVFCMMNFGNAVLYQTLKHHISYKQYFMKDFWIFMSFRFRLNSTILDRSLLKNIIYLIWLPGHIITYKCQACNENLAYAMIWPQKHSFYLKQRSNQLQSPSRLGTKYIDLPLCTFQ